MKINLGKLLSFNAGYVDTASFMALHGLFAAHVTGNFVTLGAALASDNHSGALAKLFALPMFCIVILFTRIIYQSYNRKGMDSYNVLLILMFILFVVAGAISTQYLPFPATDNWPGFIVGMLLVSAMAIQNALHRMQWVKEPQTTVMTGATSQLMVDIADIMFAQPTDEQKAAIHKRFKTTLPNMINFALGCAVAALVYKYALIFIFILPPIMMIGIYLKRNDYKKDL